MKIKIPAAPRGRPRTFSVEDALDRALRVFWQKGYEGTSLTDLTKAMGINRPSLYAAYGNKEDVFRKALDRYVAVNGGFFREALEKATAREVVEHLLLAGARLAGRPGNPGGCLLVRSALASGEEGDPIRIELAKRRTRNEGLIRDRFERARSEGDLPPDIDPADLARLVTTLFHGISVQAAGGASVEEMTRVAKMALACWPLRKK